VALMSAVPVLDGAGDLRDRGAAAGARLDNPESHLTACLFPVVADEVVTDRRPAHTDS
jgi:hypothetical protein